MQGFVLLIWLLFALLPPKRIAALILALGFALSFAGQYLCLWRAGQLTLQTALPLHLCGAMAVGSLAFLCKPVEALYAPIWLLGVPCALLALCFPAVLATGDALAMALSFYSVHSLIVATAVYGYRLHHKLPTRERSTFLTLLGFSVIVVMANSLLNSNYLFLQRAPQNTPLAALLARGQGAYILYLFFAAMMLCFAMASFYRFINRLAQSRSSHSLAGRYSSP